MRYEGSRDIAVVWQRRQKPNGMIVGECWFVWLGETLDSEHVSEHAAIRRARTVSSAHRRAVWILRDGVTPELMPRSL